MFAFIKSIVLRIMLISHHLGSALTGVIIFGFVVYLLDIGSFRTEGLTKGTINDAALAAMAGVSGAFIGINMLMKRLMGKDGVF